MALERIADVPNEEVKLIHHSDRGCQYASAKYVNILKERNIQISMTESGDPKDNAQAERINNTMKNELLKGKIFHNIDEVTQAVAAAVKFYNEERPHMSVDMMTPSEAALCEGEIPKKWISYREKNIKEKQNSCEIPEKGVPLQACPGLTSGPCPPVNQGQ